MNENTAAVADPQPEVEDTGLRPAADSELLGLTVSGS